MKFIIFILFVSLLINYVNALKCPSGFKIVIDPITDEYYCDVCPIGTASYNKYKDSEHCYVCDHDQYYSNQPGLVECLVCDKPNFIATIDPYLTMDFIGNNICIENRECPDGSYSIDGKICLNCPAGTSTGMNTIDVNSKKCQKCSLGYNSYAGGSCNSCPLGRYTSIFVDNTYKCLLCPPGSYCEESPVYSYKICPKGKLICLYFEKF